VYVTWTSASPSIPDVFLRCGSFPGHAQGHDIIEHTTFIREPRKLPVVLSPEEVARLLNAAPGLSGSAGIRGC
jgi:hypothetical protein